MRNDFPQRVLSAVKYVAFKDGQLDLRKINYKSLATGVAGAVVYGSPTLAGLLFIIVMIAGYFVFRR